MIEISEKAIIEITRLREKDSAGADSALRVRVVGGGCSGMSYKLEFEKRDAPHEKDKTFEKNGIEIRVDGKSALFLNGMTLDFSDGLEGKGFVFDNPNAKRTCGCGTSFSV